MFDYRVDSTCGRQNRNRAGALSEWAHAGRQHVPGGVGGLRVRDVEQRWAPYSFLPAMWRDRPHSAVQWRGVRRWSV